MKKILLIFGTRPEAIKLAPLIKRLQKEESFETKVLVTAQHREMLDQVLHLFEIEPDFDLNLMSPNQDLTQLTSKILNGCKDVFSKYRPDLVLVHGDTTTTLAASLAAFYHKIDVGHIEAGLRTFDLNSPFPEELNRQVCSKISKFHFSPTETSKTNLLREGIQEDHVYVTGNTGIDALFDTLKLIQGNEQLKTKLDSELKTKIPEIVEKKVVLITGHRRENFGAGFENICEAIKILAQKFTNFVYVYPVHLNPNVKEPVQRILSNIDNVRLIEPLDYLPFVNLMSKSYLILTDSGGIQEEAPSLGKPVLVMRETTERPEAVKSGTVKLVGTDKDLIIKNVSELILNKDRYEAMSKSQNPYGDGLACEKIIHFIKTFHD